MQTAIRSGCDKPRTELFIVDGSPAAALAVGAHRPSQESTYVLSRAAHERSDDFKQRVLKRAARIQAREHIGSLWYVVGAPPAEPASSVQLLEELLPLLERGSSVTLAAPRRHGRIVLGWIDELLGKSGSELNVSARFYADPPPAPLRRSPQLPQLALQAPSLQCA